MRNIKAYKARAISLTILASLCAFTAFSQSSLILGDGVVPDPDNRVAWMQMAPTLGYSYNRALAAMQPGREFEGFRFATADEVNTLYISAGIRERQPDWWIPVTNSFESILALIDLLGPTSYQDGHPQVFGIAEHAYVYGLDFFYGNDGGGYGITPFPFETTVFGRDYGAAAVGVFLVRSIPEPHTLWLGTWAGLLLLVCRGRN